MAVNVFSPYTLRCTLSREVDEYLVKAIARHRTWTNIYNEPTSYSLAEREIPPRLHTHLSLVLGALILSSTIR